MAEVPREELVARRPVRKRFSSTRLQDMELNFGRSKKIKRNESERIGKHKDVAVDGIAVLRPLANIKIPEASRQIESQKQSIESKEEEEEAVPKVPPDCHQNIAPEAPDSDKADVPSDDRSDRHQSLLTSNGMSDTDKVLALEVTSNEVPGTVTLVTSSTGDVCSISEALPSIKGDVGSQEDETGDQSEMGAQLSYGDQPACADQVNEETVFQCAGVEEKQATSKSVLVMECKIPSQGIQEMFELTPTGDNTAAVTCSDPQTEEKESTTLDSLASIQGPFSVEMVAPSSDQDKEVVITIKRPCVTGGNEDVIIVTPSDAAHLASPGDKPPNCVTLNAPSLQLNLPMQDDTKKQLVVDPGGMLTFDPSEAASDTVIDSTDGAKVTFVTLINADGKEPSTSESQTDSNQQDNKLWLKPNEDGVYLCDTCDYRTEKKGNMYKHRRKHLGLKPHLCNQCPYQASTSSNLKRHLLIHGDTKEHVCEQCNLKFRQKIHLIRHKKYKHETKAVQCPYCDYTCASYSPDLKLHIKRRHVMLDTAGKGCTQHFCDVCSFSTYNMRDLKQHKKFHQQGPELKLYCEHCSFVTDCVSRLERHKRTHTREKPFACGLCQYRATQKEHVLRHMRSKHQVSVGERRRNRRRVKVGFTDSMSKGTSLIVDTTGDKKVVPASSKVMVTNDGCVKVTEVAQGGKVTPSSQANPSPPPTVPCNSMEQWGKEKVFACDYCTMKFSKLINLYKHVSVQHKDVHVEAEEGWMKCIVCDYKTQRKKNLLVHMRKHNYRDGGGTLGGAGEQCQLYSCMICQYSNSRRKSLYQHMKKAHKLQIVLQPGGQASCLVENDQSMGIAEAALGEELNINTSDEEEAADTTTTTTTRGKSEIRLVQLEESSAAPQKTQTVLVEMPGGLSQAIQVLEPVDAGQGDGHAAFVEQVSHQQQQQQQQETTSQPSPATTTAAATTEVEGDQEVHLTPDQISHLSSGDFIEINGEMYKVEIMGGEGQGQITSKTEALQ